jgi:outer membrane biosynthesis protein TonB
MRRHNHEPDPTLGIIVGFLATLLFHGLVIGGYLYWNARQAEALPSHVDSELMHYEAVELLMWGEVMPEPGQLPIMANPAPEEAPPEIVELRPPPPEEPPPVVAQVQPEQPQPRPREQEVPREAPRDDSRHNPSRPVNTERLEGSPQGFRGGTSLSPTALANLFGPAQAQIQRAFNPPGSISREELARLTARVRIYVNADGRITRFTWVTRSGNALFDSSAERALNTFRLGSQRLRLPTSNQQAMDQVLEHGLEIMIEP